ncbi:cytochrome c553 [Alkalispirillum mobile]|uniref:Cytochrome c553 n=1 Tax=Alkalispirillum mobile TaxID=85925 RepID=A0A498C0G1_9GAMM|nr:cytochrome c [Alkalispirillum mobile]RLK48813.1 cytochrome c553 [Alkalispirillum mobile]
MVHKLVLTAAFGVALAIPGLAAAGDPERGAGLVASCVACHGPGGRSSMPRYPNLAGQHEAYLLSALEAYRDGDREDPEMAPQVMRFDDQELADIAAYFAEQDCD